MFEICAEGIFVTFPWWLENVKSRSKIALFSNERHFEIWFPKKRTITFFWSKLPKLGPTQKRLNFACGNYIFPKTRGNKNKPWTHSTPLTGAYSDPSGFFSKLLRFLVSQELLYFSDHHSEISRRYSMSFRRNIKNVPVLLIMVVTTINNNYLFDLQWQFIFSPVFG